MIFRSAGGAVGAPPRPLWTPQRVCLHPSKLARHLQDWFAGKHLLVSGQPLPPHDSLLIDEEKRAPGKWPGWVTNLLHDTVTSNDRKVWKVTEDRERQLERVRPGLLCKGGVDVDPEILDVQCLELAVVDLPGRQVL